MNVHHHAIAVGARVLLAGGAIGVIAVACGGSPSEDPLGRTTQAEGTCPANEEPPLTAELPVASANSLFLDLDVAGASYTVSNNAAQFLPSPNFAAYGINIPSAKTTVSIAPISGSSGGVGYTIVIQNIQSLTAQWGTWTASASGGVSVPATLNGVIDAHVTASWAGLTPGSDIAINIGQLPVSITFGTDAAGNATVPTSAVVLSDFSQDVTISGCSLAGIDCSGLVSNFVGNAEPSVQAFVASQFATALNSGGAFWKNLMVSLADQGSLIDTTGHGLTRVGTATSGGTPTGYSFAGMVLPPPANAAGDTVVVGANLQENGVCYIDCTPRTVAAACAGLSCGTTDDGCGDTITCPNLCTTGWYCAEGENYCVGDYLPCEPACPSGYVCEWPNGTVGVCVVNHRCPVGEHFCNNACVPGTGACL
jgi:hypothetical protein